MNFHRVVSFLLLPLFLLFNHTTASGHQTTTATTIHPPGGSTITAFEYQQHIQIVCSITENSDIVDTLWTIHTASDLDNGGPFAYGSGSGDSSGAGGSGDDLPPDFEIIPENDIRFSIEGSGGSVLIINLFAPELNGSVIYCRERLMGELIANFTLRSTPITVETDPEPGPIVAEEFSNITILCDIQHENVNAQEWAIQGQVLPEEGEGPFVISGPHQNTLTVLNFTEALDGTVIMCQIAKHGNKPIAQFSLHVAREVPLRLRGEELELEIEGEGCSAVDTTYFREPINRFIRQRLQLLAAQVNKDY